MPLSVKSAKTLAKTFASAAILGVALAPSNALAVTTWNWSFKTTVSDQFGSGTFTTANVTPTAGTTFQVTGISGTYNRGGTAYTITGLVTALSNQFRWNGTASSPVLADAGDGIRFNVALTEAVSMYNGLSPGTGFAPINATTSSFSGADGLITESTLQPYSPSAAAPAPLPLFGAAAAFQASRRLRRRLNGSLPAA